MFFRYMTMRNANTMYTRLRCPYDLTQALNRKRVRSLVKKKQNAIINKANPASREYGGESRRVGVRT